MILPICEKVDHDVQDRPSQRRRRAANLSPYLLTMPKSFVEYIYKNEFFSKVPNLE